MEPGGYKGLQSWGFKAGYSDCLPFPRPLTPHPPHEIPELKGSPGYVPLPAGLQPRV